MRMRNLAIWLGGFLLSFFVCWAVSSVFTDSVVPVVWDEQLRKHVRQPGTTFRFRSEGWADTVVADHGLSRLDAMTATDPNDKFLFWGDSFADSVRVAESQRAMPVFNKISTLKGVTVADGGLGVADYYFEIPRYEKAISNVVGHVILIGDIRDILPEEHVQCHCRFLSSPWRFEESQCQPSGTALKYASVINEWKLDFLHGIYRSFVDHTLDFSVGIPTLATPKASPTDGAIEVDEAWQFLVNSLKEQTKGFILFVYAPDIPRLRHGQIDFHDIEHQRMARFGAICRDNGVGFINLGSRFIRHFNESRQFVKGFFNTPPGTGHFNAAGQSLIAEALLEHFKEKEQ